MSKFQTLIVLKISVPKPEKAMHALAKSSRGETHLVGDLRRSILENHKGFFSRFVPDKFNSLHQSKKNREHLSTMHRFVALALLASLYARVSAQKDCVNQLTYFAEAGNPDIYKWSSKEPIKLKKRTVCFAIGFCLSSVFSSWSETHPCNRPSFDCSAIRINMI